MCAASEKAGRGNAGTPIVKIDVSKVAPIPEAEKEAFRKEYLNDTYLHEGDEGFQERIDNSLELMYKRWDWLQEHPEIYVNMLRVKGYNDERIQDCLDGKRPIAFSTRELHLEFRRDLRKLKEELESEFGLKDVWFVQTGSSVPGYSANPCKGFADRPSKLTNFESSDTDIVIIAESVKNIIDAMDKKNIKHKNYPCVTDRANTNKICRVGTWELNKLSDILDDFSKKWTEKLPAGLQFTFQEGIPTPFFPPWEKVVDIDNI